MAKNVERLEADVVIAGSGPGGCAIAKDLSKKGKKVILVERGGYSKSSPGTRRYFYQNIEKGLRLPLPVKGTMEGDNLIVGQAVGGGTLISAGGAFLPNVDYWRKHGIDIPQKLIAEAKKECWVNLPPDDFIGPGTKRIWEAANDIGIPFQKLYRHVDFSRCKVECDNCIYGCPEGAKWTGMVFVDEAVRCGATLLTHVKVTDIIIENGMAGGVRATGKHGQKYEINAKVVVCSAGAIHTAQILKNSGFDEAGRWFSGDPTMFAFGFVKEGKGNGGEHTMSIGYYDTERGLGFCSMLSPRPAWRSQFLQEEPLKAVTRLRRWDRTLCLFAKISDDNVGRIANDGKVSKTFTDHDRNLLEHARILMERILVKAGCDPDDIHHTSFTLGHPSLTVRVGQLLDANLETSVKNLYCCDTSVFPEAPGSPPTLTVVILAKRLCRRLETII